MAIPKHPKRPRCEGYIRHGGAFSLGPIRWEQCKRRAIVNLEFREKGKRHLKMLPACAGCWRRVREAKDQYTIAQVHHLLSGEAE